jgi:hypothetical protein
VEGELFMIDVWWYGCSTKICSSACYLETGIRDIKWQGLRLIDIDMGKSGEFLIVDSFWLPFNSRNEFLNYFSIKIAY